MVSMPRHAEDGYCEQNKSKTPTLPRSLFGLAVNSLLGSAWKAKKDLLRGSCLSEADVPVFLICYL